MERGMTLNEAYDFCTNMKEGGWNNVDIADRLQFGTGHAVSMQASEDRTMTVFSFDDGIILLNHYGEIQRFYTRKDDKQDG